VPLPRPDCIIEHDHPRDLADRRRKKRAGERVSSVHLEAGETPPGNVRAGSPTLTARRLYARQVSSAALATGLGHVQRHHRLPTSSRRLQGDRCRSSATAGPHVSRVLRPSAIGRPSGQGVTRYRCPAVGHALQVVLAAVLEGEPGAGDEVFHGRGEQPPRRTRERPRSSRRCARRSPPTFSPIVLDLPRCRTPGADLDASGRTASTIASAHRARAPRRANRTVDEEPRPRAGVDLGAAVASEHAPDDLVVALHELTPGAVAELGGPLPVEADDVGEHHGGQHPVELRPSPLGPSGRTPPTVVTTSSLVAEEDGRSRRRERIASRAPGDTIGEGAGFGFRSILGSAPPVLSASRVGTRIAVQHAADVDARPHAIERPGSARGRRRSDTSSRTTAGPPVHHRRRRESDHLAQHLGAPAFETPGLLHEARGAGHFLLSRSPRIVGSPPPRAGRIPPDEGEHALRKDAANTAKQPAGVRGAEQRRRARSRPRRGRSERRPSSSRDRATGSHRSDIPVPRLSERDDAERRAEAAQEPRVRGELQIDLRDARSNR